METKKSMLRHIVEWMRRFFSKWIMPQITLPIEPTEDESISIEAPTPEPPLILDDGASDLVTEPDQFPVKMPRKRIPIKTIYEYGEFSFKESVLDQLPLYMKYIKRMRSGDPEAYKLYSKIGANLTPPFFHWNSGKLSPWWIETMPTFGAIAFLQPKFDSEDSAASDRNICPKFFYFMKMKHPPVSVERVNSGVVYAVTAYWDELSFSKMKHGAPTEFPVVVNEDGTVRLLRSRISQTQSIRHKRGLEKGTISTITRERWGVDEWFLEWAFDHQKNPQDFLTGLFIDVCNTFQQVNSSMIRVSAKKGAVSATFGVDVTRTPRFFDDREVTLNSNGKKQRVFHIARAHMRRTADGRSIGIKTHFRGLRKFSWNGYDILITVPGREHLDILEFNAGITDSDSPEFKEHNPNEFMPVEGFADELVELMEKSAPRKSEYRGATIH
jgi:hypothetical protein